MVRGLPVTQVLGGSIPLGHPIFTFLFHSDIGSLNYIDSGQRDGTPGNAHQDPLVRVGGNPDAAICTTDDAPPEEIDGNEQPSFWIEAS